jgi:hypothetical protein
MFLVLAIPLGVLIGFLLGGRLSGLGKLKLRWLPLIFLALVIQLLVFPVFSDRAVVGVATESLHIVSYVLLAIWIVANVRLSPMLLLGLGAACNFSVLVANKGLMPASVHALQQAGFLELAGRLLQDGVYSNLVLMTTHTRLNVLGDVLYVPEWIPLSSAFSIGDTLIMLALGWLIVKGMRIDGKRTHKPA